MDFNGFKSLPDTTTPLSGPYMTAFLNAMYPIGKVEIFYDEKDHSDFMGFTWERTSLERSPVGYNPNSLDSRFKTIGNKFGSTNHKHLQTFGSNPEAIFAEVQTTEETTHSGNKLAVVNVSTYAENHPSIVLSNTYDESTFHPIEVFAFWKRVE